MNNQLPPEQLAFVQAIFEMREAQRAYYMQTTSNRLKVAKLKEAKVDALLEPYLKQGYIKPQATPPTIPNLFNPTKP
jgi:hypothetical protein